MTRLAEYLRDNKITQCDFASRIGIAQGTLSRVCSGARRPGIDTMAKIQRETAGAVPVTVWFPASEDQDQQKGAA